MQADPTIISGQTVTGAVMTEKQLKAVAVLLRSLADLLDGGQSAVKAAGISSAPGARPGEEDVLGEWRPGSAITPEIEQLLEQSRAYISPEILATGMPASHEVR